MKTILVLIVLLSAANVFGQSDSFHVPREWNKDFMISIENTSSQYGDRSLLMFTYDSCTRKATRRQGINKDKAFALSQQDRDAILAKLRELKIENIKEKKITEVLQGGDSNILCVDGRCIDGGSVSAMSDKDKELFLTACRFLQDFSRTRK